MKRSGGPTKRHAHNLISQAHAPSRQFAPIPFWRHKGESPGRWEKKLHGCKRISLAITVKSFFANADLFLVLAGKVPLRYPNSLRGYQQDQDAEC